MENTQRNTYETAIDLAVKEGIRAAAPKTDKVNLRLFNSDTEEQEDDFSGFSAQEEDDGK